MASTIGASRMTTGSDRLGGTGADNIWEPRRLVTLANVRRRSERVSLLRLAFIAIAAIAIGMLMGHVVAHALRVRFAEPPEKLSGASVRMLSPRFTGRDASGTPYIITAAAAVRRPDNPDIIDLERPKIEDTLGSVVIADTGVFERDRGVLLLTGNVVVREVEGNIFVSDSTEYLVEAKRVTGQSAVRGIGPLGEVRADGYDVNEAGDVLTLTGNVWTRLYPERRASVAIGEGPAAGLDFLQLKDATQPSPPPRSAQPGPAAPPAPSEQTPVNNGGG